MRMCAVAAFLAGSCWAAAGAEPYPSRPVTLNVPYAAGGPLDVVMRVVAEGLRASLGQPIVIENVTGAGGSIGVGRVARAAPDGYTVSAGNWSTHVANGAIYPLPYDLRTAFEPVSLIPFEDNVIIARQSFPANTLAELIAWLTLNPGKALAGTSGLGGPSYMAAAFFQMRTGTTFSLVPYRGAGPALQDLVAGQLDIMSTAPAIALPHVRAGTVKALAVFARERMKVAPDIPTSDEAGLPGFYFSVWSGLWVPKGTPQEVIDRLTRAVRDAVADPAVRQRLAELSIETPPPDELGPEHLRALHQAEIDKWWPIIKAAGIKGE